MMKKLPTIKQRLGKRGENKAAEYLIKQGYTLVKKNYRYRHLELDLVFTKNGVLVIVEVKSLLAPTLGPPVFRVNRNKQKNIVSATWAFLSQNPEYHGFNVQFDIIIVNFSNYPALVTHYEGAFIEESRKC
jgi:putative endonuclease